MCYVLFNVFTHWCLCVCTFKFIIFYYSSHSQSTIQFSIWWLPYTIITALHTCTILYMYRVDSFWWCRGIHTHRDSELLTMYMTTCWVRPLFGGCMVNRGHICVRPTACVVSYVQYIACSFVDSYVCKYVAIHTGPVTVSCDPPWDHVLSLVMHVEKRLYTCKHCV